MSGSAAIAARCSRSAFHDLVATLRAHAWLIAPTEIYLIVVYATALLLGRPGSFSFLGYERAFSIATPILCGGFLIGHAMYLMVFIRPRRLIHTIIDDLRSNYLTRQRLLQAVPIVIMLPLFNSACGLAKSLIPALHPYDWDATFAHWDTTLHFGVAPWQALAPILATPLMTSAANLIYCGWFFGLASLWFWQAFALRDRLLRMQFFLAYMACFIVLGNVVATILAAGGPCYYGRLVDGPDPYAPLMQYLGRVDLPGYLNISVGLQDMLWSYYATGGSGVGSGISAMPSMHVAGATLFALLGWRTHRILGIALSVNVGLILMATVFLGWHYAIDGYVAIIGTVVIWCTVGAILRRLAAPAQYVGA